MKWPPCSFLYISNRIYLSDTLTPEPSFTVRIFFHLTVASPFAIPGGRHVPRPRRGYWTFRQALGLCLHCKDTAKIKAEHQNYKVIPCASRSDISYLIGKVLYFDCQAPPSIACSKSAAGSVSHDSQASAFAALRWRSK
jgi:hypothetical protein